MNLSPLPIQKFFDNNGRPLVGGLLFTYAAGTSNKVATYVDSSGVTPNTNPIVLDFRGECRVWLDPQQSYKFILSPEGDTDPPTSPIWTVDDITVAPQAFDNSSVDTGSVNNISLDIPQISSAVLFTRVSFRMANTNTGATTLQINGGTAHPVTWQSTVPLTGGELQAGGIYQAIFDGARWQLQATLYAGDVRNFGAVGDGVTDDTAAIQAAFSNVVATGDAVVISNGVYKIVGTITTGPIDDKKTSIIGMGGVLKQFSNGVNTLNIRNSRIDLRGLRFENDAGVTASNSVAAIDVLDVSDVSITDCIFNDLNTRGIAIRADASGDAADISIKGCHFNDCSGTSISANSEDGARFVRRLSIVGNTFQAPTSPVSDQTRAIHLVANVTDVTISANICSGTAAADYSAGWRDCFMIGNSSATQQIDRVTVTGNRITGMGDDGVGISGAKNVTITGNVIHTSLVTSGVYVPGDGTWTNDNIVVCGNVIFDCELAGVFMKDTISYDVSGNEIYDCQDGVVSNDNNPPAVVRGVIANNIISDVERRGIHWDGGICNCHGNIIDGFGDAGSGVESEKAGIFLSDAAAGSIISDNVMMNGIHGFVITGAPTQFVVSNNVVRSSCTGYGASFIAFTGDNFLITNNVFAAATGSLNGAPAVTASKVIDRLIPQQATQFFTQAWASANTLTPAQITANQNDYTPTGWLTSLVVRLSSDASRNITGFGRDGTNLIKWILNVGAQNIVLTNQDAASTSNQRIITPSGVNFTLTAGSGVQLAYDGTADRWRVVSIP